MRALEKSFLTVRAYREKFMRGELSRITKSFKIELRLANSCINFVRLKSLHFDIVQSVGLQCFLFTKTIR